MACNTKKVSVIVPCYNAAKYLEQCIEKLLHQTIGMEDIEIILVDDASTDEGATKKLIMKYEQYFPDTVIAVFLPQNMRQGGARNAGLAYSSGEYIIFCDADDWILEETLEHCYNIAVKYDADIVEFGRRKVNTRDGEVPVKKGSRDMLLELDTKEKKKELLLNTMRGPGDSSSQNTLFKYSLVKEYDISFVEHMFMEEPFFTFPAILYAKRYYYLDEQLYIYYQSPESTVRSSNWENRKWDLIYAWVTLFEALVQRGLYQSYQQEIDYLFFITGFGHCIQLIFQKNSVLTKEEWEIITGVTLKLIPGIRQNRYVKGEEGSFNKAWNNLLLWLLETEYTDESAQEANQSMKMCMDALWSCSAFH